jgi:hypothetical protein
VRCAPWRKPDATWCVPRSLGMARIVLVFKNGEEVLVERNEWDEWRASS